MTDARRGGGGAARSLSPSSLPAPLALRTALPILRAALPALRAGFPILPTALPAHRAALLALRAALLALRAALLALCAGLSIALAPAPAGAATLRVPDEYPTIRSALDVATAGDTVLIACGRYEERDLGPRAGVTLRGQTGDPACVEIDAGGSGRILFCDGLDGMVKVEGLTLRGGRAEAGGGIYCNASALWLVDCAIADCSATNGGALWCNNASPALEGCTIAHNSASALGGGIYIQQASAPFITRTTFLENEAASGGALFSNASLEGRIESCTFIRNEARNLGGAITCGHTPPAVARSTFVANAAPEGSGIAVLGPSPLAVDRSVIVWGTGGPAVTCRPQGSADLACCNIAGNAGGDWVGCLEDQASEAGNISESPVFCDPVQDDYRLRVDSPCAPFSQPNPECDLIGAWPVACDIPSSLQPSTWGWIKSVYLSR